MSHKRCVREVDNVVFVDFAWGTVAPPPVETSVVEGYVHYFGKSPNGTWYVDDTDLDNIIDQLVRKRVRLTIEVLDE